MAPTVLIVPGWWVGPKPFNSVVRHLEESGLKAQVMSLPSTGTTSLCNPRMKDNTASVRNHIESILARGEDVLLGLHSAGGFIGGAATQGLLKKTVEETRLDGARYCSDPAKLLYSDLSEMEQGEWVARLTTQPAQGCSDRIPYTPWNDIPSVYIVCEKDNALPPHLQEKLAGLAGSKLKRVSAGHMAMLGVAKRVADIIVEVIKTVELK